MELRDLPADRTRRRIDGCAGFDEARIVQVSSDVIWSPLKETQVGAEALDTNMFDSGLAATAANIKGDTTNPNPDEYRARLSSRHAF